MKDVNTLGRDIFLKTVYMVVILWAIFYGFTLFEIDTKPFCTSVNNPVYTILTGSLLHGNLSHLVGNTISLFISVPLVLYLYKKDFWNITVLGLLGSGGISYMFPDYTLGISGLVFAYMFYIIFRGLGSKDKSRFFIAIILLLINGGLIYSMTPLARFGIAWWSHLGGAISAFFYALYRYRK